MPKIYIAFDDESVLENGLPKGVSFISSSIFSFVETGDGLPTGAREATDDELVTPQSVLDDMAADIERAGDTYQNKFLSTNSANREARFRLNIEAATRLLLDEYVLPRDEAQKAADAQSLTWQTDAQGEGRSVEEFAQWVVDWHPQSILISGAIEAFIKESKMALPSIPYLIDPAVRAQHYASLITAANAKFEAMTS